MSFPPLIWVLKLRVEIVAKMALLWKMPSAHPVEKREGGPREMMSNLVQPHHDKGARAYLSGNDKLSMFLVMGLSPAVAAAEARVGLTKTCSVGAGCAPTRTDA